MKTNIMNVLKKAQKIAAVFVVFTFVLAPVAPMSAQVPDPSEYPELDLSSYVCHATESGYDKESVGLLEIFAIAILHVGHADHGDDIIPDFVVDYPAWAGQNWDENGQAIWNNDCVVPSDSEEDGDEGNDEPAITIHATKITCDNETYLPKYGTGGPDIDANTVGDWFAADEERANHCYATPDWAFEWATEDAENPGNSEVGPAEGDWETFGPTDENGVVTAELTADDIDGSDHLWVREVLADGYIPFSGWKSNGDNTPTPEEEITAELYCTSDVLNYDNFDRVEDLGNDGIQLGETYYCVAWNITKPGTITLVKEVPGLEDWSFDFIGDIPGMTSPVALTSVAPSVSFYEVVPGVYNVSELVPEGWNVSISCDEEDIDQNSVVDEENGQVAILLDPDEEVTCTFTNREEEPSELSCASGNLLVNGSFESPEVAEVDWDIFPSGASGLAWVVTWADDFEGAPETADIELQESVSNWTASDGDQYTELDSDWGGPSSQQTGEAASVRISQTVATVNGGTYGLMFDFAARPGTDETENILGIDVDGATDTLSVDGSSDNTPAWTHHEYLITADDSTDVSFEDLGESNSVGTFLDNVVLCLIDDEGGGSNGGPYSLDVTITGDGVGSVGSADLGIACHTTVEGEEVVNDCSESYPAGTVVNIVATPNEGSNFDSSWSVGAGTCTGNTTPCQITMSGNVSLTGHFALNGGGSSNPSSNSNGGGGGGGGKKISLSNNGGNSGGNEGPEGEVAGAQTSILPAGAPNTGAGGAADNVPGILGLIALVLSAFGFRKLAGE